MILASVSPPGRCLPGCLLFQLCTPLHTPVSRTLTNCRNGIVHIRHWCPSCPSASSVLSSVGTGDIRKANLINSVSYQVDPAIADMIKNKEKTTLESEYEKIKDNRFEEWDNIRGPRPWEDSKSYQEQQKIKNNMKT
ncbi:cytochrome c oxidase assembly protein COX16 homolog, mitochondrial isoform X1 [Lithobates pipiens]